MSEISNLNNLISEVSSYMETWSTFKSNAAESEDKTMEFMIIEPSPGFFSDFNKLLKLFNLALNPMHCQWFDSYFRGKSPISRKDVHYLLEAHYIALKLRCKNAYVCLLYIYSFTFSLQQYCQERDMKEMLSPIQFSLEKAYIYIQYKFILAGGWEGLTKFCQSQNLHTILLFIRDCYCEVGALNTYLHDPVGYVFGIHGIETMHLFNKIVDAFEESVRNGFDKEINQYPDYKEKVEVAFTHLRKSLEFGPVQNYLSQDKCRIKYDPTSPLSQVGSYF